VHLAVASSDTAYLKAREAKAGRTVLGDGTKETLWFLKCDESSGRVGRDEM
jgi:hypothetical protein